MLSILIKLIMRITIKGNTQKNYDVFNWQVRRSPEYSPVIYMTDNVSRQPTTEDPFIQLTIYFLFDFSFTGTITIYQPRPIAELSYYRPQRSWAKVIFSEACVKNSVHWGGGGVGLVPGGSGPGRSPIFHGSPNFRGGLQFGGGGCLQIFKFPRYGSWAAGTHPTGMHSCL